MRMDRALWWQRNHRQTPSQVGPVRYGGPWPKKPPPGKESALILADALAGLQSLLLEAGLSEAASHPHLLAFVATFLLPSRHTYRFVCGLMLTPGGRQRARAWRLCQLLRHRLEEEEVDKMYCQVETRV